jgi:hypothetical protein
MSHSARSSAADVPTIAYVVLWMTVIVTPLYWIIFFATMNLTPAPTDVGLRFELAFPAADMWMALAAALGAIGLRRGWRLGYPMAAATAGALLYLALMDITFDLENGVYLLQRGQVVVEVVINVLCVSGAALLFYALLRSNPVAAGGAGGDP